MRTLLVEDDEFKASDIQKLVEEVLPSADLMRAMSVTSSLQVISGEEFPLIILDMSLPTFDMSQPGGGGSPQGQGGLEVLRLVRRLSKASAVIIVTQYPDIEIDGEDVPLEAAPRLLRARFETDVLACLPYQFDGDDWRPPLKEQLKKFAK